MDIYKILLIVLIVFILYFTYYYVIGKSSYTLTSVTKTTTPYVVSSDTINQINQNMAVSNYAISVWAYIDKWDLTLTPKNIINIPNILDITLGNVTNNLNVSVAYKGIDTDDPIDPDDPDNPVDPVDPDDPVETCPGNTVSATDLTCCDVLNSRYTTGIYNMGNVAVNTVYQNAYNNYEYTFVYNSKQSDGREWYEVQVYFIRPALLKDSSPLTSANFPDSITASTVITDDMIISGTPYDGFKLESHGSLNTGNDLLSKQASSTAQNCNWQTYSVKDQLYTCYSSSNDNSPIHTIISSQSNTCNGLRSVTISLKDKMTNKPYFNTDNVQDSMIPYFTFRYYTADYSSTSLITSTPTRLVNIPFPPVSTRISGFTNNNNNIKTLYTPSSLFNIYNNNTITGSSSVSPSTSTSKSYASSASSSYSLYNTQEGIAVPSLYFNGVVNNVPLQTWFNITVNIMNRSLDIYINGKLEQTYIIPGVPNQMDGTPISVAAPPTFTGWTSNLQYYPYNLNPQTVWSIYQQGYTSNSSILSLLSKYSIKLIFVDNSTKNQVVI